MSYTKKQIIEFLSKQESIEKAIGNIDYLDKEGRKVLHNGKIVFYIEDNITTKGQLKTRIIKHMGDNAWEKGGYEEEMTLDELLESLYLTIS